eukprot:1157380-Pelagomonas_calceolata.AAC.10
MAGPPTLPGPYSGTDTLSFIKVTTGSAAALQPGQLLCRLGILSIDGIQVLLELLQGGLHACSHARACIQNTMKHAGHCLSPSPLELCQGGLHALTHARTHARTYAHKSRLAHLDKRRAALHAWTGAHPPILYLRLKCVSSVDSHAMNRLPLLLYVNKGHKFSHAAQLAYERAAWIALLHQRACSSLLIRGPGACGCMACSKHSCEYLTTQDYAPDLELRFGRL